jgi:hypothetical protein
MNSTTACFVRHVGDECRRFGIQLQLLKKKHIMCDGFSTSGFFREEEGKIAVAIGKPEEDWVATLAHEFSHFNQFKTRAKVWRNLTIGSSDAGTLVELWIQKIIELNEKQIRKYISAVRDLELDCEKRTVRLIRKFKLSTDTKTYTMEANAYIMFYNAVMKLRKWCKPGKPPYNNSKILAKMSDRFDMNYSSISPSLLNIYRPIMVNVSPAV